jgi:hypothetical protein
MKSNEIIHITLIQYKYKTNTKTTPYSTIKYNKTNRRSHHTSCNSIIKFNSIIHISSPYSMQHNADLILIIISSSSYSIQFNSIHILIIIIIIIIMLIMILLTLTVCVMSSLLARSAATESSSSSTCTCSRTCPAD